MYSTRESRPATIGVLGASRTVGAKNCFFALLGPLAGVERVRDEAWEGLQQANRRSGEHASLKTPFSIELSCLLGSFPRQIQISQE